MASVLFQGPITREAVRVFKLEVRQYNRKYCAMCRFLEHLDHRADKVFIDECLEYMDSCRPMPLESRMKQKPVSKFMETFKTYTFTGQDGKETTLTDADKVKITPPKANTKRKEKRT